MSALDVQGILERAGANPGAPEGSEGWALAQVAKSHDELVTTRYELAANADRMRAEAAVAQEISAAQLNAAIAQRDALAAALRRAVEAAEARMPCATFLDDARAALAKAGAA